jgi:hypothetical protein
VSLPSESPLEAAQRSAEFHRLMFESVKQDRERLAEALTAANARIAAAYDEGASDGVAAERAAIVAWLQATSTAWAWPESAVHLAAEIAAGAHLPSATEGGE